MTQAPHQRKRSWVGLATCVVAWSVITYLAVIGLGVLVLSAWLLRWI